MMFSVGTDRPSASFSCFLCSNTQSKWSSFKNNICQRLTHYEQDPSVYLKDMLAKSEIAVRPFEDPIVDHIGRE
jgi:hypothetical protein